MNTTATHPVITGWLNKCETEQYKILIGCIRSASKCYGLSYVFNLLEFDEIVSHVWIELQKLLTDEHIKRMEHKFKQSEKHSETQVTIGHIIHHAAIRALTKINNENKKHPTAESLQKLVSKESNKNMELEETFIDLRQSASVEMIAISNVMVQELLSKVDEFKQSILLYVAQGYSIKEIGKILGRPPKIVGDHLSTARKQLGRKSKNHEAGIKAFENFLVLYKRVLSGELTPHQVQNQLCMPNRKSYYRYVDMWKTLNNIPIPESRQKRLPKKLLGNVCVA
jgi:hypothetical protein